MPPRANVMASYQQVLSEPLKQRDLILTPALTNCAGALTRNQIGLLKVSQSESLPESKPRLNHLTRCAEVPWLKLSGTT